MFPISKNILDCSKAGGGGDFLSRVIYRTTDSNRFGICVMLCIKIIPKREVLQLKCRTNGDFCLCYHHRIHPLLSTTIHSLAIYTLLA